MHYDYKSRKHGVVRFTWSGQGSSPYLWVQFENDGQRWQCCHGGGGMGNTVCVYGDNEARSKDICRKWFREFLKAEREYAI